MCTYEKSRVGPPWELYTIETLSRPYRCAFFPGVRLESAVMDPLREIGKLLLVFGLVLLSTGALLLLGARLPFRLGRLPGDIVYRGQHTTFYFPVVTCLLLSAVLTLVFWLISHFRR